MDDSAAPRMIRPSPIARSADIVEFVHRWYKFGGGSAYDIYVQFGLPVEVFFTRASRALCDDPHHEYSPSTVAAMRDVCHARARLTSGEGRSSAVQ